MARLLSVNVGVPKDIVVNGAVVRTAIWKEPVKGRVMARRMNLDGDGQADLIGHGGEQRAVLVYQSASYLYWERFLGRAPMPMGQFGENLTVEGMPDNEVCIGDRYRIGRAVFEVSQPRGNLSQACIAVGSTRHAGIGCATRPTRLLYAGDRRRGCRCGRRDREAGIRPALHECRCHRYPSLRLPPSCR